MLYVVLGCGNNIWGAECTLVCSNSPGGSCEGNYFCAPDPVGCSCIAGFMGEDCKTGKIITYKISSSYYVVVVRYPAFK